MICLQGDVEKVVSGEGIAHAYRWLREARPALLTDAALDANVLAAEASAVPLNAYCTVFSMLDCPEQTTTSPTMLARLAAVLRVLLALAMAARVV